MTDLYSSLSQAIDDVDYCRRDTVPLALIKEAAGKLGCYYEAIRRLRPLCNIPKHHETLLVMIDEVEKAIRERDQLSAKLSRLRLRTLGTDGPPEEWPVLLFLEKSSEWQNRVTECEGLDCGNWRIGHGRWIAKKSKPTDRYLPVAALLEEI